MGSLRTLTLARGENFLIDDLVIAIGSTHAQSEATYRCPTKSNIEVMSSSLGLLATVAH
jgi:hypothetical protein